MRVNFLNRSFSVIECRLMESGGWGMIDISTCFGRPAYKWVRTPNMTEFDYTCDEPPPMHIYPMPAMYPRDVFLGITNAHLEMVRRAVASGQLPKVA